MFELGALISTAKNSHLEVFKPKAGASSAYTRRYSRSLNSVRNESSADSEISK